MHLSLPIRHSQTHSTYPTPHGGCEERERTPRSSTCTLLVVVETAGPVVGVTSQWPGVVPYT
eukprot:732259-Prymnesium_polylepis.1